MMVTDTDREIATAAPDPAALRAFLAVARSGGVARAAAVLGRAQPTVSARIAALEQAWSTRLFRRQARGMSLTPEGARLLPLAEAALHALDDLGRAAGRPVAADEVRLGSGDALARELLPRVLAVLAAERPGLEVRLVEGPGTALLDSLRRGEIDVALVAEPDRPSVLVDVDVQVLAASPVDVLFPAGEAPRRSGPVPLEALATRRLVALQPGSTFRRHVERAFAAAGIPFRAAVEVGNLSLVRRFVAAGLGVAPVPSVAFDASGLGAEIRRIPMRSIDPVRYARAVRAGVPLSASSMRLLDLLREEMATAAGRRAVPGLREQPPRRSSGCGGALRSRRKRSTT